jgi:hypothetical protein
MPGPKRYDAFISYRHRDAEAVHRIARRLADEARLELFVDAWNLVPGDRFTAPLADAVRASRCVAAFKGPEGMSSGASFSSSPFTPITRWFDLDGGLESLLLTRPLRLLVVSASPSGHPPVALARELAQLKDSLSEAALFERAAGSTTATGHAGTTMRS